MNLGFSGNIGRLDLYILVCIASSRAVKLVTSEPWTKEKALKHSSKLEFQSSYLVLQTFTPDSSQRLNQTSQK